MKIKTFWELAENGIYTADKFTDLGDRDYLKEHLGEMREDCRRGFGSEGLKEEALKLDYRAGSAKIFGLIKQWFLESFRLLDSKAKRISTGELNSDYFITSATAKKFGIEPDKYIYQNDKTGKKFYSSFEVIFLLRTNPELFSLVSKLRDQRSPDDNLAPIDLTAWLEEAFRIEQINFLGATFREPFSARKQLIAAKKNKQKRNKQKKIRQQRETRKLHE